MKLVTDAKQDKLIEKAIWQRATPAELDELAAIAKDPTSQDLLSVLYALGRAAAVEYEDIFESYLCLRDKPSVTGMALRCLCVYFGMSSKYKSYIEKYLKPFEIDEGGELLHDAIWCAGEYLSENNDTVMAGIILAYLNDANTSKYNRWGAFSAICKSLGMSGAESSDFLDTYNDTGVADEQIINAFRQKFSLLVYH